MPKKRYAKKRNWKRRAKKQLFGKPPKRALSAPNVYRFKRTIATDVALNPNDAFWQSQGNNIGRAFAFALGDLDDHSDFQDLFKYYRLKGARVRMYFSNTGSNITSNGTAFPNSQIMVTIDRNLNGETADVADEPHYLQSQTAKRIIALGGDRKPVDIYMPLKQGNLVYQSINPAHTVSTGVGGSVTIPQIPVANTTMMNPKFLSTEAVSTPHWGYNMMLQRIDGNAFSDGSSNYQAVKILTTLYFECKKVE